MPRTAPAAPPMAAPSSAGAKVPPTAESMAPRWPASAEAVDCTVGRYCAHTAWTAATTSQTMSANTIPIAPRQGGRHPRRAVGAVCSITMSWVTEASIMQSLLCTRGHLGVGEGSSTPGGRVTDGALPAGSPAGSPAHHGRVAMSHRVAWPPGADRCTCQLMAEQPRLARASHLLKCCVSELIASYTPYTNERKGRWAPAPAAAAFAPSHGRVRRA